MKAGWSVIPLVDSAVALFSIWIHPLSVLPDGHVDLYYLGYENKHAI